MTFFTYLFLKIRGINTTPSTYSTAKCAMDTKPPGPTIVVNVTGSISVLSASVMWHNRSISVTSDLFGRNNMANTD